MLSEFQEGSIQRNLSKAQAFPVLGFIIASPVKATVSVVQIVASGVLGGVSFGCGLFGNSKSMDFAAKSLGCNFDGWVSLGYSAANIISLGILGIIVESQFVKYP